MTAYIKICGLTTEDMVSAAVAAGANAVGFVFAPSPRQVTVDQAVALLEPVRHQVDSVAVMRHPDPSEAVKIMERLQPTYVQTDAGDFKTLGPVSGVAQLPVFRCDTVAADLWDQLHDLSQEPILFESGKSGSGERADWELAAQVAAKHRVILAGGLNADNVAEAIDQVHPWGVDVSSGVESSPGIKDAEKIAQFVKTVRDQ